VNLLRATKFPSDLRIANQKQPVNQIADFEAELSHAKNQPIFILFYLLLCRRSVLLFSPAPNTPHVMRDSLSLWILFD
jgi:hypothetical protein